MKIPRWDLEAETLDDGRVLVIGEPRVVAPRSSEIYDPATGTWSLAPPPIVPRSFTKMVRLDDGRVLVVGGGWPPSAAGAEIFDPATNSWRATAPMGRQRTAVGLAKLSDGRVLVYGGRPYDGGSYWSGEAVHAAEIYDPVTNSWAFTADLSRPRVGAVSTVLPDGSVLAIGGDRVDLMETTVERFLPGQQVWIQQASLLGPRVGQRAAALTDGRTLVTGGCCLRVPPGLQVETLPDLAPQPSKIYDDSFGWLPTPMPTPRYDHTMTMLPDGRALVVGGSVPRRDSPYDDEDLRDVSVYDPRSGQWAQLQGLIQPRTRHAAALLLDGSVLIAGGTTNDITTLSAEVIRP